MQTVVCFGDSNTWGASPSGPARYDRKTRWPGVLQNLLSPDVHVVEEGLCGRTACYADPLSPGRNGLEFLPIVLQTHEPIDLLIIMLGTNECKAKYNLRAYDIAQGIARLAENALSGDPVVKKVLLISPAHIVACDQYERIHGLEGGIEKSQEIYQHLLYFSEKLGCSLFNAAEVIKTSPIDGLHLEAEEHTKLARALCPVIKSLL